MKDSEMEIRRAEAGDTEAVMGILAGTGFFRDCELVVAREVLESAAGAGQGYESFVAVTGGKVVGWVCFGATPCTVGTFDVYWVAVERGFQGRGVGAELMRFAEAAIEGAGGRLIVVDTSGSERYLPTRRFYERLGYIAENRIMDFYAAGDDKVIYVKRL